jgi:hypothetical protein
MADDVKPSNVASFGIKSLRNTETETNTIRVDSKVVEELDSGNTKSDDSKIIEKVFSERIQLGHDFDVGDDIVIIPIASPR